MITLPVPPRAAHLKSFWLAFSMMLGTGTAICLHVLAVPHLLAISAVGVLLLVGTSVFATDSIQPLYTVWNRGARFVGRVARRLVLGVCFFIVFAGVGLLGARFGRKVPNRASSGWDRRRPAIGEENRSPLAEKRLTRVAWMPAYVRWARRSGNLWAVVLIPFLSLLSLLAEEEEDTLPAFVYTLF
jgi:hypothetical protein